MTFNKDIYIRNLGHLQGKIDMYVEVLEFVRNQAELTHEKAQTLLAESQEPSASREQLIESITVSNLALAYSDYLKELTEKATRVKAESDNLRHKFKAYSDKITNK